MKQILKIVLIVLLGLFILNIILIATDRYIIHSKTNKPVKSEIKNQLKN